MRIIQIVPRIAPGLDGIGDYALILAERLRSLSGIHTQFLACSHSPDDPEMFAGFAIRHLQMKNAENLCSTIRDMTLGDRKIHVVLQFAAYGYAKKGCPWWLLKGLQRWRSDQEGKLISMFHELTAGGTPPWKSSFWLNPVQRSIIGGLSKCSDDVLTNTLLYKNVLSNWGFSNVTVSPTFSNIGEPEFRIPMSDRDRQIVVFGRPWQRQKVYRENLPQLEAACNAVGAETIVDIGAPFGNKLTAAGKISIVSCGMLPAPRVSEILSRSLGCYICYPKGLLTKSGVFAASCSHGAIPFIMDESSTNPPPELTEGLDYFSVSDTCPTWQLKHSEVLSINIFGSYQQRNSIQAARIYATMLKR